MAIRYEIINMLSGKMERSDIDPDLARQVCDQWNREDLWFPGPQGPYQVIEVEEP